MLIGGSFTDPNHDNPGDIDAVILIPEPHQENPDLHEVYQKMLKKIPAGIDIHFLPEYYDLSHYKAYSNISHLASKPNDKQKETEVANNSFKLRELVKINL
ncbi:hypothetical protein ABIE26_002529 [Pedobacter africanus]|uniref:Uncharacterized protein n=1 Tax=Pedobacter africanus TaxID=151894 RepID=A0ACC6KY24_9SPHI|nr:hypothetical protein [Pedobacter africanus]MDR6784082.1 hypothetical protein [Pedobacter africanus]